MNSSPFLSLRGVVKSFGNFTALDRIDLDIKEGEFFTIVGPSGSGKSTLIRLLVGMDDLTDGEIRLRDKRIDDTPANKRPTCMVFQSLALFPHMTVGQNIEFPLKLRKEAPDRRKARALELLDLLRLPQSYYDKRVSQCSGGEKQRVALARALAFDPEILFFDEPLSALDYRLRKTLEKELKDLHARTGKTFVYITHSLEEAMVMSDRIAIMKQGRIEQISVADEIYGAPVSRFVAEFMGEVNLFDVTVAADGAVSSDVLSSRSGVKLKPTGQGARGLLMVRPEYVGFADSADAFDFTLSGPLHGEYALGSRIQYEIETPTGMVTVEKLREDRRSVSEGETLTVGFNVENTHFIDEAP
ncbi:ABC transporter ATP-binding protein [Roseovarius atlanticus]|uniref:ABC transporter ATP-binding protein n=1 Tax=Roseovarius atlanticus TaxID=1641875 RepID=UPI001C96A982|nr:ABC transporter ATP-binding protein [Roseovarius atlanticus]MBY5987720.1 ABC transporter ATP-binding protein [Roseovarius atlanticus]MBY6123111.1 ABC transporter ATP-binding protein [Roseovarius atlanticus]MBY6147607.1 ABC transporter ATP-binding protein [Roseovarius atlanticus]